MSALAGEFAGICAGALGVGQDPVGLEVAKTGIGRPDIGLHAGIPQDRETYYFGATGGGVWKTTDGGRTWSELTEGLPEGELGRIERLLAHQAVGDQPLQRRTGAPGNPVDEATQRGRAAVAAHSNPGELSGGWCTHSNSE